MERLNFIDLLKAISIFLVVYGHNDLGGSDINAYLSTLRIPLFFALSGFVSKDKSGINLFAFVKKISKRLLIPYFIISFFLYFVWFIQVWLVDFNCLYCDPARNFIGVFYSQGGESFMAWGGPMWFLTALFCVAMIDYFVSQVEFRYRIGFALLLPLIGLFLQQQLRFRLPWSLSIAMVAYFFYFAGFFLRRIDFNKMISGKELYVFIVAFSLHFFLYRFNKPVDFFHGVFGFLPLLMLNGLLGFIWIFSLIKKAPVFKPFLWIGRNTLPILALHILALSMVHWLAFTILFPNLEGGTIVYFTLSVIEIIMLVPFILFLNRYFPLVLGIPQERSPKVELLQTKEIVVFDGFGNKHRN